jgi:hypothetical protein
MRGFLASYEKIADRRNRTGRTGERAGSASGEKILTGNRKKY